MFSWPSQLSEYYPLPGTGSDSMVYPQFVPSDTSLVQPNVDFNNNASGSSTPRSSSPTWGRGSKPRPQNEGKVTSVPDEDKLEEEAEFFGTMLKETRRNTVNVTRATEQLSGALEQLNSLRAAVDQLREKVAQLEARHNEDRQSVDSVVSTLKSFRGIFHHLVQRLSMPIGLGYEDFVVPDDNDQCS
ncbi:hypothetical protein BDV11DRAFT_169146 [Aspergillus similis]